MKISGPDYREVDILKNNNGISLAAKDRIVSEEPLEIRIDGHPVAVIMRTPGHDSDLVTGFLRTEGILHQLSDARKMEADGNRMLVFLADGVAVDIGKLSRNMFAGSSCGICGKATIEALHIDLPRIAMSWMPCEQHLLNGPSLLLSKQKNFAFTGGLHAAGLFGENGELLGVREDIGRHNAVDKIIGHALREGWDLTRSWLLVSGRVSFEIMQKSLAASIPCVAAISAPSSLAVEFAQTSGQCLIGFLRPPTFNIYHSGKIREIEERVSHQPMEPLRENPHRPLH